MDDKIPQTRANLEEILTHTWSSLQDACAKFDAGETLYALNIATDLRKLLKDSKQSKSLLGQLGMKEHLFLDSSPRPHGVTIGPISGLFCSPVGGDNPKFIPYLDDHTSFSQPRRVLFEEWWTMVVLTDGDGQRFTRADLVLYVSEQGGGAHVDPSLDAEYAKLANGSSMKTVTYQNGGPELLVKEPDRAAIRQIAHEVLREFVDSYPKHAMKLPQGAVAAIGPASFLSEDQVPIEWLVKMKKFGRNKPCPCGALKKDGEKKKFKKCHGS